MPGDWAYFDILREFRDRLLKANAAGKAFVRFYYKYSPVLAEFISNHDGLKAMVQIGMLPVVGMIWLVLKLGFMLMLVCMIIMGSGLIGMVAAWRMLKR
jgi:hypothetical protein